MQGNGSQYARWNLSYGTPVLMVHPPSGDTNIDLEKNVLIIFVSVQGTGTLSFVGGLIINYPYKIFEKWTGAPKN